MNNARLSHRTLNIEAHDDIGERTGKVQVTYNTHVRMHYSAHLLSTLCFQDISLCFVRSIERVNNYKPIVSRG